MGLSEEEQRQSQELRLQLNSDSTVERSIDDFTDDRANLCESQAQDAGCCQGSASFCCRENHKVPEKGKSPDTNEAAESASEKNMRLRKQMSSHSNSKGASYERSRNLPTWFESWEREDTYAVLAVIAAAASVAFAYNCYKHLN